MADAHREKIDAGQAALSTALYAMDLKVDSAPKNKIVDVVKELVKQSKDAKDEFWVPRWLQSLYFVLGHQHIFWSSGRRRWFPMLLTADKRITVNMIKSRWLNDAARLGRSMPTFQVIPTVPAVDAREQARVGLRVLKDLHRRTDMTRKRALADMQRALFGTVFMKSGWDDQADPQPPAPMMALGLDGQPIMNDAGQPEILMDGKGRVKMQPQEPAGDIGVSLRSVFDIHAPVSAITPFPRDWPWIAEKVAVPVGEILLRWDAEVAPDEKAVDITQQLNLDLGRYFSRGDQVFGDTRSADTAWVIEYHEAPSNTEGFEMGRRIIIAGDQLVVNEPGELPDGRIPYHSFPVIPIPLTPWADCFIPEELEPQMAYNRARGHLDRARSRLAHPHMFSHVGAIAGDQVTEGGRYLEINPGREFPVIPELPGISSAVVAELRASKEDIDSAASQYSMSRGEPLGASPNPVGTVELMQQADLTDLSFGIQLGAQAMADLGEDLLDLARHHYDKTRIGFLVGEGEDPDIFEYSRSDMSPGLKVVVQEGSEMPQMKEGLRAQLSEVLKSGIFTPMMQDPRFVEKILDLYEMPAPDDLASLTTLDTKVQERETRRILAGEGGVPQQPQAQPGTVGLAAAPMPDMSQVFPINETDDDQAHLQSVDRRTKYADWKDVPPDRQGALMAHRGLHIQRLQQQMMQQMQMQAQMAAAQPQGGKPPGEGDGNA